MDKKEIIIKESALSKLIAIFIFFVIFLVVIIKSDKKNFEITKFGENGLISFFYILIILLFLSIFLKIFDNNPTLKINEIGIWYRSAFIPFMPLKLVEWNKVEFVELNIVKYSKYKKGDGIIIYKKDSLRIKTIYLDDLNHPKEDIIKMFKNYSSFLNFKDRIEVKKDF